jgi:formyltetrahydrofolate deformylase
MGLFAAVSDFIYRNDGNIIHADQHTDQEEHIFLQRVEWQTGNFRLGREEITEAFSPIAERFEMDWDLRFTDHIPRVAIFVSRMEHCLYDLLGRYRAGDLRAEIPLVISNHEDLRPLAENFDIAYQHYAITAETKAQQEQNIIAKLAEERIDLVVLARYMQIVGPEFVACYPNRIINIHHSFLPAFAGARPYHLAYERGVKIIGATAHYVTEELDQGPIIEQDVARVSHRDSVDDLVRKGKDLEKIVLARAVGLHLRHRVLVYKNKTVVFE